VKSPTGLKDHALPGLHCSVKKTGLASKDKNKQFGKAFCPKPFLYGRKP